MKMKHPAGFSRDVIKPRYALLTPDAFVPSRLPGWTNCTINIVISPAMGANLAQSLVTMEKSGRALSATRDDEMFVYVIEGRCTAIVSDRGRVLSAGYYAYVPPHSEYELRSARAGTRLLIFQKHFVSLAGKNTPEVFWGNAAKIKGLPFRGNTKAFLQTLLPDEVAFDMAVNIFTYQPGAVLPFAETHIMEHGVLMLAGAGIYRLDADWHPVQAGDVIWMAPHCPQWFAAIGDGPASYIYYKDVNRAPL
jgi:(S)-ureidoglycine aminohydrolase